MDLHNLLNFIKLRNSNNAQYEIKEYASCIQDIITELCPITMEAYNEYKTISLSKKQIETIEVNQDKHFDELSKREKQELTNYFKHFIIK